MKLTEILRREKQDIKRHYNAKLQTTKQTLTTANTQLNLLTVTLLRGRSGRSHATLPVTPARAAATETTLNRDKIALTNRRWKCNRYRKKHRSRARNKPIKFEDLGFWTAQMLEKKMAGYWPSSFLVCEANI